jgi:hypothetical protein
LYTARACSSNSTPERLRITLPYPLPQTQLHTPLLSARRFRVPGSDRGK